MTDAALSAAILGLALLLFVSDRIRHDLVASLALVACLLSGLVAPGDALRGFSDPAVVAVAAVLVVGRAVELTGVASKLTRTLVPANAPFAMQLAILMMVGAALSAFMNNIAALVITMPLAMDIARRTKLAPGAALMPLAFATILGGMTTLIGTPANLILSSIREDELGAPLGFFSMSTVGIAVCAIGLVYLALVGWRLIPHRKGADRAIRPWRVFELWITRETDLAALRVTVRRAGARIIARFRGESKLAPEEAAATGDMLLMISRASQWQVAAEADLSAREPGRGTDSVTARVVVGHGSRLIGEGYESVTAHSGGAVIVVAGGPRAARLGQPLGRIRIEPGDQLFLRGPAAVIADLLPKARLLEVDRFDPAPLDPRRGALTVLIFAGAIATAVAGVASPAIAFLVAAIAVAGLRLIPPGEVYQSIDWTVVLLLAAVIPVGRAFEASGAANLVATFLASQLAGHDLFWILAALCAGTLLLSIFLNNVATAIVMGPVAIQLAAALGFDPDAALLAVLVGASSDFLTPIGHQNNLLVMGPGGYRFKDYARAGAPLAILTIVTAAFVLSWTAR